MKIKEQKLSHEGGEATGETNNRAGIGAKAFVRWRAGTEVNVLAVQQLAASLKRL